MFLLLCSVTNNPQHSCSCFLPINRDSFTIADFCVNCLFSSLCRWFQTTMSRRKSLWVLVGQTKRYKKKNIFRHHFRIPEKKTIKIPIMWHLLDPNKHVFLTLEKNFCMPGRLCSTTVLHDNAVLSHIVPLSKNCSFCDSYCTWQHCDFDNFWLIFKPRHSVIYHAILSWFNLYNVVICCYIATNLVNLQLSLSEEKVKRQSYAFIW